MNNLISVKSHKGVYQVEFYDSIKLELYDERKDIIFLIDRNIYNFYTKKINKLAKKFSIIFIKANEKNKSLESIVKVYKKLLSKNVKKNFTIVAVGGGIIQDITCFIASNLFRGISWEYIPTTLLSQCDSCIGSKSSINLLNYKNVIGTFNPPKKIYVFNNFLKTLNNFEINSGIGEILKFHLINSYESFYKISKKINYKKVKINNFKKIILNTLMIKKKFIEKDEFDQNIRRLFNYGHSFGHAIETASNYKIPHGIAISMGMYIANNYSDTIKNLDKKKLNYINMILSKNFLKFKNKKINFQVFQKSLKKDKKNIGKKITLILPTNYTFEIFKTQIEPNSKFWNICEEILSNIKKL